MILRPHGQIAATVRDAEAQHGLSTRELPYLPPQGGQSGCSSNSPNTLPADYDRYAADDDRGYGWVVFAGVLLLMLGTPNSIEGLAAVGNVLAGNANVQLMMIPAYPFWSLPIFTLDILAIYGLIAYGRRISSAD